MVTPCTHPSSSPGLRAARRPSRWRLAALLPTAALAASLLGPGATPTLAASAPSAPQDVHLTSGPLSLEVTWAAPAADEGSPLTEYTVYYVNSSTFVQNVGPSATQDTATFLAPSSGWAASVCAVNAEGQACAGAPEVVDVQPQSSSSSSSSWAPVPGPECGCRQSLAPRY
jgi:hypothetical protein